MEVFANLCKIKAYLLSDPKAKSIAGTMPTKNLRGFLRRQTRYSRGNTINPWINNPTSTVTVKMARSLKVFVGSSISAILDAMRKAMPTGEYLLKRKERNKLTSDNVFY